ncbi:MAG: signal recognition particle-docking protein FtsY [Chloroflexota bacterium]|nr:signal recognition particle-docking protein FtsY [Chloroflexota bacterium]
MPFGFLNRKGGRDEAERGLERSRATFFGRLKDLVVRGGAGEDVWDEAEELLIEADVGVGLAMELLDRARDRSRGAHSAEEVFDALKADILEVLNSVEVEENGAGEHKPLVVLVVGVNGAGKTTSIAKLAALFRAEGKRVVLAAADTFRAAAIEQLQHWGERAGADVIAHQQGGDPAAVAFDAMQAARARNADVLIVDTAGRLHTKSNLMEEMKKIGRVLGRVDDAAPHEVLLVLDATTGQNGLAQAKEFTQAVGCTGIVLTKLDGTAKGGVVLAIARELRLPVRFVGTGEGMDDLSPFAPEEYVEALFDAGR